MSADRRGTPAAPQARGTAPADLLPDARAGARADAGARAGARARLTARPAPADLGSRALAAAGRRRRARGVSALSAAVAVAALVVTGLLVPRGDAPLGDAPGAVPGAALARGEPGRASRGGGLPAATLLPLGAVRTLLPGAGASVPPTDLSGAAPLGGYCRDLPLLPPGGLPEPTLVWAAEWSREAPAGVDPAGADGVGAVREEVLRWSGAASATAYTHAVRQSPTTCRDPRGGGFPGTVYTPLAVDERSGAADTPPPADDTGAPLLSLAAARVGASVPGTPTWRVRAVFARDATAVNLTAVLRATDAETAARSTLRLLDLALDRAVAAAPAGPGARVGDPDGPSPVPGTGTGAGAGTGAALVLGTEQVVAVVPGARALGAPVRLAPPTAGPGVFVGGWCSWPLRDVPLPDEVWSARWAQPEAQPGARSPGTGGGPLVVAGVEQTLLRFGSPGGADAYADATSRSADRCPLTDGAGEHTLQPGRPGLPRRTVAVGPGVVPGSWSVRAVDVRGATVVVLAVLVPAPDAGAAAARGQDLLDAALDRAGQGS